MKTIFSNITMAAVAAACLAPQAWAQRNLKPDAIPVPDPQKQMETFILDEGLEINLFASDPMIAKPIGMNWDSEGRLWVVSSRLYPQIEPGQRSNDQVIVLEDQNNDGKADKSTVFAENLLIPTGIMPGDGGVYVANSTEILFLKDTDGNLKEDKRRVILSGFGTEDTHHIIHAFRGGPDGMLYFNQSIYIHSHIETPHGVRRLMAGGIWHFRPETMELDVFARGFVNSWGHVWDRYGQSFATDGAYGEGINYVFPGSVFVTAYNSKRKMRGLNPGQPKQCGLEVVNSSHFPEEWQGNMITNDFRGHRVNRFVLSESGSGFVSRQAADVIRTKHGAFRPIDVKVGPDGALYIADWYNPIIQHGEVDFRDPRRDHVHGRIWRVSYKGRPLAKKPDVAGQPVTKIVSQLRSVDGVTRHFAKRELRKAKREEALVALKTLQATAGLTEEDRLEILWANQSVNELNEPLLRELLGSKDHRVRAAAVRVLYHWHGRVKDSLALLKKAASDSHPRVRLESVSALRQVGGKDAFAAVLSVHNQPLDQNLDFALWLTAREMKDEWLPALEKGELDTRGKIAGLQFALKAIENPGALRMLRAQLADSNTSAKNFEEIATLFAEIGTPEDLDAVYDVALSETQSKERRGAAISKLFMAANNRNAKPKKVRAGQLVNLLKSRSLVRTPIAALCGAWKIEEARATMMEMLTAPGDTPERAVDGLMRLGGDKSFEALSRLSSMKAKRWDLRARAGIGLTLIDAKNAAPFCADLLTDPRASSPMLDGLFQNFLGKKNGAVVLADALKGKKLSAEVATAGVKLASSSGGDTKSLVAALTNAGGLQPIVRALSAAEMKTMVAEVSKNGNAARGQAVYRKKALACQTCHAIGGGGGLIGPDLVSIGASAPVDYIFDSLLEPGKKIKEGYHTTVVTTKDNKVITGGLVRESNREVVLRLADGKEQVVLKSNIAKNEVVPVSLMPPGLTASLRRDELVDLVRFLSELGKEGGFKTPKERYVRRWRVLPYDNKVSNRIRRAGSNTLLTSGEPLPWQPAYSEVDGGLPLGDVGVNTGFNNRLSIAKFEIEVTASGAIGLKIADPKALQILFGKKMLEAKDTVSIELPAGLHEFIVMVDRDVRKDGALKISLVDVEGSEGRATTVGGL